jgi:hypothetical protein
MMSALSIMAAAALTFICSPAYESPNYYVPYVISLERDGDRIRYVVVIWQSGEQSRERWRGTSTSTGISLRNAERCFPIEITMGWDSTRPEIARMSVVGGGNPSCGGLILRSDDEATCSVRSGNVYQ